MTELKCVIFLQLSVEQHIPVNQWSSDYIFFFKEMAADMTMSLQAHPLAQSHL